MSLLTTNPKGFIYKLGNSDEEVFHFKLNQALFISFYLSDEKVSLEGAFGLCLDSQEVQSTQWWETLQKDNFFIKNYQNKNLSFKMVSHSTPTRVVQKILQEKSIKLLKCLEKDEPTEVVFNKLTGKIRVQNTQELKKIKLLIVDDSPSIRSILRKIFSSDPHLDIVAEAERPSQVEELIQKFKPDVMTLDIHMPEMDGVTLLKKLIVKYPIPTVMISSISMEEGPLVFNALEAGAVDYVQKPSLSELDDVGRIMIEKIKIASSIDIRKIKNKIRPVRIKSNISHSKLETEGRFILIGSSTGGTEALKEILTRLPENIPPMLIVQHIPPVFSSAFAHRMNELCPFEVKEGVDGEEIKSSTVYIAPGGKHMKIKKIGQTFKIQIEDSALVNRHKPSVDVLFESAASLIAKQSVVVILTGMGADGAKGMLKLKNSGALSTIAQDEASSVVYGMPREAVRLGGASKVLNLFDIPEEIIRQLNTTSKSKAS